MAKRTTRKPVRQTVNVGVIGTGIGQAHIEGFRALPNVNVVGIVDLDPKRAKAVAEKWNVKRYFANHEDLLGLKDLDAVTVGTPNWLHAPIAIDALKAGKHVLCEKPMAHALDDGEKLFRAAKKAKTTFMMAYNNRFRGDAQLLHQYVGAGELGEVYFGRCGWTRRSGIPGAGGWFTTKGLSGGGPLIDIGVHALDLCWWLMGKPKPTSVSSSVFTCLTPQEWQRLGRPGTMDTEDAAVAHIRFGNGAAIMLEASWVLHTPVSGFYCHVMGTKGGASLEPEFRIVQERYGAQVDLTPRPPNVNGHMAEIAHFVDCIVNDKEPISTAQDGVVVLRMLDAIYRSGESRKEIRLDG